MVGVIGSVIGVLDDSPFSDFVADLLIHLLGAMEMAFESLKKKVKEMVQRVKQKV